MNCDICRGAIEMRTGGMAVCSVCGMIYSAERLREKINSSEKPDITAKSAQKGTAETELLQAKQAIRQQDYSKAVNICEKILSRDYHNMTAWKTKITALLRDNYGNNAMKAADCFAEACSLIEDPAERNSFINELSTLFMEEIYLNNNTAQIAKNLASVDSKLAEKYLLNMLNEKVPSVKRSCDDAISTLRDYNKEAQTDIRWNVLMGKEWNRVSSWINQYLEYALQIWVFCGENCSIENRMLELVNTMKKTAEEAHKIMSSRSDILRTISSANYLSARINEKINKKAREEEEARRAAIRKYWEEHADIKEQLEKQKQELEESLKKLKNSLDASENMQRKRQLTDAITKLNQELNALGFFEFSKKKAVKQRIAAATAEMEQVRQFLHKEERDADREEKRINIEISSIDKKLENPLR